MAYPDSTSPSNFGRRQFLQMTAVAGAVALTGSSVASLLRATQSTTHHATRLLMGTRINLTVIGTDGRQAQAAINATFGAMTQLVGIFDHRQPASPLATLNREGALNNPPPALLDLLRRAVTYGDLTNGAFDVTVKPLLDLQRAGKAVTATVRRLVDYRQLVLDEHQVRCAIPGAAVTLDGIAKGRVIDGGVAALRQLGFDQVLVEAGGDLRTLGHRPDGHPWRVGIAHPRAAAPGELLAALPVDAQAVATSGDYMHFFAADFSRHHIVDPRSGVSPAELAGATVLAATATDADALSTALLVLGSEQGLALAARLPGVEAVLVTKDLRVLQTSGVVST